ncbi:sterol esterase [Ramaria rubella]|nr:sterol esterase [Ramaria rubella]
MFYFIPLLLMVSTFTIALPSHESRQAGPTVALSYGTFQGSTAQGMDSFLGIPFAQAERVPLRFGLPQTPAALTGVQQAVNFGPSCPQQAINWPNITLPNPPSMARRTDSTSSEDCLFVNVIKPSTIASGATLPVVFWIFGGGFQAGDTSDNDGSTVVGRSIALNEPIIYVSANYRLNAFGFLGSTEVQTAGVGNLGLRDQRFAMQWIQNNIALFGGDPTKVTIWGESAGAVSVGLHLLLDSGSTGGLFRGAFMESGGPLPLTAITTGQQYYDQLVASTGCASSNDTFSCLKGVSLEALQAAVQGIPCVDSFKSLNLPWRPYIDNELITEDPMVSVSSGVYARVPFVAGNCDDEGTLFSLTSVNLTTDQEAEDYLHSNYLTSASDTQFQSVMTFYPSDPTQGSPFGTGTDCQVTPEFKRIAAFQGDYLLQAPRRVFMQMASNTQDIWGFLYQRGKTASCMGAEHSNDLPEFFGGPGSDFQGTDALVNFVTNLDPNTPSTNSGLSTLIEWPKYSSNTSAPPLLTFVDPSSLELSPDTYRAEGFEAFSALFSFYTV